MSTNDPHEQEPGHESRAARLSAAERSAEIAAAARAVALDDGLSSLTQRAVAERAGVARNALYAAALELTRGSGRTAAPDAAR